MKWKSLSPKKRRQVLLAALGALVSLGGGLQFGLRPALEGLRRSRENAAGLRERLLRDEDLLQREARIAGRHREIAGDWAGGIRNLPPEHGPFLWLTERLYRAARDTGVRIESLQEWSPAVPEWIVKPPRPGAAGRGAEGGAEGAAAPKATRYFGPYGAQLIAQAGYEETAQFLGRLEAESPLMTVSALSITAGRTPEQQTVRMTLEWPRYMGPEADRPGRIPDAPKEGGP